VNWSEVTPWGTTSDAGCYLSPIATDPSTGGIVYVSGSQNLWQSQDGGGTWRIVGSFPGAGQVSVSATDGNRVVVAVGIQVFVSVDALAAGTPTFTDITRNLPSRSVLRAAFDPADPAVLYAVLGGFDGPGPGQQGHVFRTTIAGSTWTDVSPPVDVPHGALALDGTDTPTTLYVGTDLGVLRSVDRGSSWTVLDDIHFPRVPVTDLVIGRGSRMLRASTYGRGVFELTRPDFPAIAVNLEGNLDFGTVCGSATRSLTLQVFNVGSGRLELDSVQRALGSSGFTVLPSPGTPVPVEAGEELDFTVVFTPTTPGTPEAAVIRIRSNDPEAPVVDVLATGLGGVARLHVVVPDRGDFGEVCLGDIVDRELVLNNAGDCPLRITRITSSVPEFEVPSVLTFPIVVAPGASVDVPVRFRPSGRGTVAGALQIVSNDPASPATVRLRGESPPPRLVLSIADAGDFGAVCVGEFRDEPLLISNSGDCLLTVTGLTSSDPAFLVPRVDALPLTVDAGDAVELTLRFQPTAFGPAGATITVDSDDPGGVRSLDVTGHAPSGTIVVTGTTDFGAVELGVHARQSISVCNVGDCDLHVTRVAFNPPCPCDAVRHHDCGCGGGGCGCGGHGPHGHGHHGERGDAVEKAGQEGCGCDQRCLNFRILNNPFPATVHPGSCLAVLLEYVPTCDNSACCELVVVSDDPATPEVTLFVTGHLLRTLRSALKCWAAQELHSILEAGEH
jgi:hypothetical protein